MYKNQTFLAIIPARGGSKRLPRKNILELKKHLKIIIQKQNVR
jgi:CMP-N-acetylneuraminic acid synthetase